MCFYQGRQARGIIQEKGTHLSSNLKPAGHESLSVSSLVHLGSLSSNQQLILSKLEHAPSTCFLARDS